MAPGVDGLPPAAGPRRAGEPQAAGAVDTVDPVERLLAALPYRPVRQVKLALWALELLPFAADLLLFLKVLTGLGYGNDARVRAAVGTEMSCAVADGAPPLADGHRG